MFSLFSVSGSMSNAWYTLIKNGTICQPRRPAPCAGVTFLLHSTQQHVVGTTFGQINSDGCSEFPFDEACSRVCETSFSIRTEKCSQPGVITAAQHWLDRTDLETACDWLLFPSLTPLPYTHISAKRLYTLQASRMLCLTVFCSVITFL